MYRDRTLTWQGRRLLSYAKDGKAANFTYDANGIRTYKDISQNGVSHTSSKYIYDGNNLVAEQRDGSWIYYLYGVDGVVGFNYNDATYLYRKNVQGDVTHIYKQNNDASLELVAQYVYDAWGNCRVLVDVGGIAELNPFRYRSYYFDEETGLYYLQTRYYDPETGRFINADTLEYLDPETIDGLNLYAYCGNNPVMRIDSQGSDWDSFWKSVRDWFVDAGNWINDNIIQPTVEFLIKYGDILVGVVIAIGLTIFSIATWGFGTVFLGMLVGAIVGAGFGAANAAYNHENVLYGALLGAFVGMLSGIGGPGISGMIVSGIASGFGAAATSLLNDMINNRPKDYKKAAISGIVTTFFAGLGNGAGNYLDKAASGFLERIFGNFIPGLFASTIIWVSDLLRSIRIR